MKKIATILAVTAMTFASCSKAGPEGGSIDVSNDKSESIVTGGVYDIAYSTAGIYGYLNMASEMMVAVDFGILYSTSPNPTRNNGITQYSSSVNSENRFDVEAYGLEPGRTYYYCAFIKYISGNFQLGKVRSFTTLTLPVSVNAESSNIKQSSATISGKFTAESQIRFPERAYLYYSSQATTSDELKDDGYQETISVNSEGSFSVDLNYLDAQSTYYYVVVAEIEGVQVTSELKQFTTESIPELVDLGLSVKWRSWNLGASKPEEYGGYYQWAGTEDVSNTNIYLDLANCPYHVTIYDDYGWSKYIPWDMQSYWYGSGSPDNKTVLDPEDDAAHVNLGGKWRMPTKEDWWELKEHCSWDWTTLNGVKGYMVTSLIPGYTDNYIFLPCAGERAKYDLNDVGKAGWYWSSSLSTDIPSTAWYIFLNTVWNDVTYGYYRYAGFSVRPVSE